ncbi:MAG: rRNA maturation RNase YbeY [Bacteroidota bacterium]
MDRIQFFSEEIPFQIDKEDSVKDWILLFVKSVGAHIEQLNYIFMSDEALLKMNQSYLSHDYYTDILTFPMREDPELLEADIYISVERVKDNAASMGNEFRDELHRVMIHGVLHLLGQDDHGENAEMMRKREEAALALRIF